MTDEEKQRDRACKEACVARLADIDLRSYRLGTIDRRLTTYAKELTGSPDGHNLYELLALERFLGMLDRYTFRVDKVKQFIDFYELLKFSGVNGRQRYSLTPVQVFQFANIIGFYKDEAHRLFHDVLLFVPRKFSKTTEVASLAVYDLLFGDSNSQCYTTANTYQQAKICFDEIRGVLRGLDPGLSHFKLNRELVSWKEQSGKESFIRCLASNADKLDGLNASVVINDEYAQADSDELYNVLTTSMGMRENPLVVTITTASSKPDAPFVSMLEHSKAVLRGEAEDDMTFAHLFMPDVDDAEDDPQTWRKVQPHLGITVKEDFYPNMWKKAQISAGNMRDFRTKLLNVFDTDTGQTWISGQTVRDHMRHIGTEAMRQARMSCEVGVDLSVKDDFSAVSYLLYDKARQQSHILTHYYLPRQTLEKHPNRMLYNRWVEAGYMRVCGDETIDARQIAHDIWEMGSYCIIRGIGFDPNRAQTFQNELMAMGGQKFMKAYKQTNYYFTRAVEATEELLFNGKLTFDDNPINAYCYDNAVLDVDKMENRKPMKKSANLKIDGCITATMAIGLAIEQKNL
jgi:phage terminase large subunit-like protein